MHIPDYPDLITAFLDCPLPAKFTCEDMDPECMDHDHKLRSLRRGKIELKDVHNPGYSIFSEILPSALAYYFADFAALALSGKSDQSEWFGESLILSLDASFRGVCNLAQRKTVHAFLAFVDLHGDLYLRPDFYGYFAKIFSEWKGSSVQ